MKAKRAFCSMRRAAKVDPVAAARALRAMGVGNVILKLGGRGSLLLAEDDDPVFIAPHAVDAVDTTAAGDAFNGAFAAALAEGAKPEDAARFASAAAALAVTRRGARDSMPFRPEIERSLSLRLPSAPPTTRVGTYPCATSSIATPGMTTRSPSCWRPPRSISRASLPSMEMPRSRARPGTRWTFSILRASTFSYFEDRKRRCDGPARTPTFTANRGWMARSFPGHRGNRPPSDAIEFIAQEVARSPGAISIIATGPLTNLARALDNIRTSSPASPRCRSWEARQGGNTTPVAEFNAFSDPEALDALLALVHPDAHDRIRPDVGHRTDRSPHHPPGRQRLTGRHLHRKSHALLPRETNRGDRPRHRASTRCLRRVSLISHHISPPTRNVVPRSSSTDTLTTGMVVFDRRPQQTERSLPSPFANRRPIKLCTALSSTEMLDRIMDAILRLPLRS